MALVLYKEKIFKLWDLTEGKSVYTKQTERQIEKAYWSPDGTNYVLQYEDGIEFCSMSEEECINEI